MGIAREQADEPLKCSVWQVAEVALLIGRLLALHLGAGELDIHRGFDLGGFDTFERAARQHRRFERELRREPALTCGWMGPCRSCSR